MNLFCFLQTNYYWQIIGPVAPELSEDADEARRIREKLNRTILYGVVARLIDANFLANRCTWIGNSTRNALKTVKLSARSNLLKWIHHFMLFYDAQISEAYIGAFLQQKICKPGVRRATKKNVRKSVGR